MLTLFRELGFTEKEVQIYLLLAQAGKSTAQLLAKRAKLPRTTVYSILESLTKKGLVAEERSSASTFFVINKPSALLRGVEAEAVRIKRKEVVARELIDQIQPLFKSKLFGTPKVQFFEGKAGVDNMLHDHHEEWQTSLLSVDSCWWTILDRSFREQYREWLQFFRARTTKSEQCYCLSDTEDAAWALPASKVQKLPAGSKLSCSIIVAGDFVIFLVTHEEPHHAFELRDTAIASAVRLFFGLQYS